jgi:hypothetical protein
MRLPLGFTEKIAGRASVLAAVRLVPVELLTEQHGHRPQKSHSRVPPSG